MPVTDATAPCDPNAALMSDGSLAMPQPYATINVLGNAAAAIFLGVAAALAAPRHRFLVGIVTWLFSGFALYVMDTMIWQHMSPPP